MSKTIRRNRLMPWYIGFAIVAAAVIYIGYQMFFIGCPAPTIVELIVLLVVPGVYLGLMYLTFVSESRDTQV